MNSHFFKCYNIIARENELRRKIFMKQTLDILSHDEEMNTIFARGVSGSITLDIIPDALQYLKMRPEFKQLYLQDYTGISIVLNQGSTIESALNDWQVACDLRRGTYQFKHSQPAKPVAPATPSADGAAMML